MFASLLGPAAATVQGAQTAHEAEHPGIRIAGFAILALGLYYLVTKGLKKR
jgi:hypothetical protein